MRYLQALLYVVAATLAPVGAGASQHARATAVLYRQLEASVTASHAAEVTDYLEVVDPRWAGSAQRLLRSPTSARVDKVLRHLSDRKQKFTRFAGEPAWRNAMHHARMMRAFV